MKAPRPSFLDRYKQMMLATPRDLGAAAKVVLWALFAFAHDDGTSIFVGSDALVDFTGLPRRTLFNNLKLLADKGYILDDGWKQHGPGIRTKLRRIDIEALIRDRAAETTQLDLDESSDWDDSGNSAIGGTNNVTGSSANGYPSAMGGTNPSAVDGTYPSAMGGTQTKRVNQESKPRDSAPEKIPDQAASSEPAPKPPATTKPAKSRTQVPSDFVPNETGQAYAAARRVNAAAELPMFLNHHAAKGTLFLDWQAAWRTWCDHAVQFGRSSPIMAPPRDRTTGAAVTPMSGGF